MSDIKETFFQEAKTEEMIINAFLDLLAKKSMDRITISELTKLVGIHRQTFYYYFEDIQGLAVKTYKNRVCAHMDRPQGGKPIDQRLKDYLAFLQENRTVITRIKDGVGLSKLNNASLAVITPLKEEMMARLEFQGIYGARRDFAVRYMCHGAICLINDWFYGIIDIKDDELAQRLNELMNIVIFGLGKETRP